MKNILIHYSVDLILFICFLIAGITGLMIFPGLLKIIGINLNDLPKIQIYYYHHWLGLILLLIAFIHFQLHWKWYITTTKKIITRTKKTKISPKTIFRYLLNIGLLLSAISLFITGILKFPEFLPSIGINRLSSPINELSFIHDWSGLFAVLFAVIHLILHISWIVKTAKKISQQIRLKSTNDQ